MPQMPAIFVLVVYRSQRYIASGSVLAPILKAVQGEVGPSSAWHLLKASSYSCRMSLRTFSARW